MSDNHAKAQQLRHSHQVFIEGGEHWISHAHTLDWNHTGHEHVVGPRTGNVHWSTLAEMRMRRELQLG